MSDRIADSLVLVFTFGMSIKGWRESGMLDREIALYEALAPKYGRVIMVTYGDMGDEEILRRALPSELQGRFHVVSNDQQAPILDYKDSLAERVAGIIGDDRTVVVKTNQMAGGEAAVRITQALRRAGKSVGLIARGGYLWTRFVTHEHGPHSEEANDAAGRERYLCQAADMVVGTTGEMVEDLAWRYGINPAQTRVIPNYVLAEGEPVPDTDRQRGLILYAGQLVARKRVQILIDAFAAVPEDVRSQMTLEIIGDGPERRDLMERARTCNVHVEFKARVPHRQLMDRMRQCMIYAQASELEGHPKTVLEAMSVGAVVVVADAPGLGNVVEHGSSGIKVQPTVDAFSTAFAELMNDSDWREMLGSTAARVTRRTYSLDAILPLEVETHTQALVVGAAKIMHKAA